MKKLLGLIAALMVALVIAVAVIWNKEIKTVLSVEQVDEAGYLYEMNYCAEYDLDEIINADIDENKKLLNFVVNKLSKGLGNFACTSFQALKADSTGYFYGRNYDMFKNPTLVVRNKPENGYASISTCDMSHFGYSLDKLPNTLRNKVLCIAAVYAPMDGMNEKGLCTSIMALPKQPAYQNTGKHVVGTSIFMRLILDRCATVQEALDLVATLDVRHDQEAGSGYHYMIADASGDCAVVEFDKEDGWKTMIVRKDPEKSYMHVTNHLLSPKYYTETPDPAVGNPHSKSWWRYETVFGYMEEHGGRLSLDEAQECLAKVHWKDLVWENGMVEDTQFSNVYDQSALTLSLRHWNEYEKTYRFSVFPR